MEVEKSETRLERLEDAFLKTAARIQTKLAKNQRITDYDIKRYFRVKDAYLEEKRSNYHPPEAA